MNLRGFWTTNPFVHPWYQPWHLDDNQCAPLEVDQWGVMGQQAKVLQKKIQFQKRPASRSCHSARFSDRRRSPAALREMTTLHPHLYECTEKGSNFVLYLNMICLLLYLHRLDTLLDYILKFCMHTLRIPIYRKITL